MTEEKRQRQAPRSRRIVALLKTMQPEGLTVRAVAEQFCGGVDVACRKRAHSLLHALKLRGLVERRAVDGGDPIYVIADAPVRPAAARPPVNAAPIPVIAEAVPPVEEDWAPDPAVVEAMERGVEAERHQWFLGWKTVDFVCCEPREPISLVVSAMSARQRPVQAHVIAKESDMAEYIAKRYLKRLCAEGLAWRSYGHEEVLRYALSDRCRLMLGEKLLFSGDM